MEGEDKYPRLPGLFDKEYGTIIKFYNGKDLNYWCWKPLFPKGFHYKCLHANGAQK
jgi:hypothetical protein